jgi:hypothetical protein
MYYPVNTAKYDKITVHAYVNILTKIDLATQKYLIKHTVMEVRYNIYSEIDI